MVKTVELPREPSEVASTVCYRTPVGSTASVPGSISYPEPLLPFQSFPEPVLPFQDPSGDEDEEDAFVIMKQSPEQLQGWKLNPGLLEAIEEQKRVLAYTVVHTGQVPRRSCSAENDSPDIEIGPTLGQLFVGFEHIQPDEVLVFAVKKKSAGTNSLGQIEKSYDALSPAEVEKFLAISANCDDEGAHSLR